jgi:hypothetical protein
LKADSYSFHRSRYSLQMWEPEVHYRIHNPRISEPLLSCLVIEVAQSV